MYRQIIKITSVAIVIITLISVAGAVPVLAAQPPLNSINALVPCGNGNGNQLNVGYGTTPDATSTAACNFAGLVDLIKNVTNFLVILSAPIFVGIMVWAGIRLLLFPGNPETLKKVKQVLFNTLISFIIILAGWLIVHVIATTFLKSSFNIFQP